MDANSLNLVSVHAVEMPFSAGSETICASPLCNVSFSQGGLPIEPKRYCSDLCRQRASIIRRAAVFFIGVSDTEMVRLIRSVK